MNTSLTEKQDALLRLSGLDTDGADVFIHKIQAIQNIKQKILEAQIPTQETTALSNHYIMVNFNHSDNNIPQRECKPIETVSCTNTYEHQGRHYFQSIKVVNT